MGNAPQTDNGEKEHHKEFKWFAAKRILLGAVGIVLVLWLVSYGLRFFETPETAQNAFAPQAADEQTGHEAASTEGNETAAGHGPAAAVETPAEAARPAPAAHAAAVPADEVHAPSQAPAEGPPAETAHGSPAAGEKTAPATAGHAAFSTSGVRGVAFVDAMIAPMHYELYERFYGWRPNDIIEWTDNVNNYQLGVLEVTRRSAEVLAERISRTGSTQSFEKELEKARSNFNINADQYWLPSAETSYKEALDLLESYKGKLMNGTAFFYNRTDNLIPLLRAYENLLGSCDDNLIKTKEDDGSNVSWFMADNYFYYAKGVASAMHTILEAVAVDFANTIETRRGTEVLHHALEALHHATSIDPWLVTDAAPDGILANHRANMAGPISHARFYIGLLVETLST
jgi:hypothetical protein